MTENCNNYQTAYLPYCSLMRQPVKVDIKNILMATSQYLDISQT